MHRLANGRMPPASLHTVLVFLIYREALSHGSPFNYLLSKMSVKGSIILFLKAFQKSSTNGNKFFGRYLLFEQKKSIRLIAVMKTSKLHIYLHLYTQFVTYVSIDFQISAFYFVIFQRALQYAPADLIT